jgi:hypothetical protein
MLSPERAFTIAAVCLFLLFQIETPRNAMPTSKPLFGCAKTAGLNVD